MNKPSEKALVILDDEASYVDLLAQLLATKLPCPIQTFTRPLTALQRIQEREPGLVITDYHMPEIDGLDFVRRLHRLFPHIPVIMISGHAQYLGGIIDRAELPSLRCILPKPFHWRVLADEVVRHWPGARGH